MGDAALAGSAVGTPAGPASCSVDSAAGPCWLWFVACCSGSSVCAEASARSLEGSGDPPSAAGNAVEPERRRLVTVATGGANVLLRN